MDGAIPLMVAGVQYPSKQALKEVVAKVLNEPLHRLPDDQFTRIYCLFLRHPLAKHFLNVWDIYTVRGCKRCSDTMIQVGPSPKRCFLLVCSDGQRACLNPAHCIYPIPHARELIDACRAAVMDQIVATKRSLAVGIPFSDSQTITCALSGEAYPWGSIEMDHVPPRTMTQLVWDWLWMRGEYINEIKLYKEDGSWRMADPEQAISWRAYHQEHAVLRPLHKDIHKAVSSLWYQFEWATLSSTVWWVDDSLQAARRPKRWPRLRVISGGR